MRILTLIVALWLAAKTSGAEWGQFRGPQASGVEAGAPAPVRWNVGTGENVLFRTPIPGLAHASPVVWRDRVYCLTAVGPGEAELKVGLYGDIKSANDQAEHQWRLLAVHRRTGAVLWDKLGHRAIPRVKRHPKASHGSSTPATDGERIVAIFGSEGLFCFDRDGTLRWHQDLGPMDAGYFQVPSAQWGFGSSPVIHEGKVVVLCDVLTKPYIAVFDLASGKQLWRVPRQDVPTWSTPTVVTTARGTHILVNGWRETAGYDFGTGAKIWTLNGGGDIPVPTPIVGHGLAYFTSAHGRVRPMRAIRLEAQGDITPRDAGATNTAIAWAHARQGNYMQTPILVGDKLYGCHDNGVLTCFEARSGEIQYSERLGNGAEGFTSSPVSDGRNLYFASEVGRVYVVPATGSFSVIATNSLEEMCMASPAVSSGTLLYRTRSHLVGVSEQATTP